MDQRLLREIFSSSPLDSVAVNQARDDLGQYEHMSTIPRGGATTFNDVGDIHDAAPPSPFIFLSPSIRPGWSEQPAEVSILSLLQLQSLTLQPITYFSRK